MTLLNEITYYAIIIVSVFNFILCKLAIYETGHKIPNKIYGIAAYTSLAVAFCYMSMDSPSQYPQAYGGEEIMVIQFGIIIYTLIPSYLAIRAIKYCKAIKTA